MSISLDKGQEKRIDILLENQGRNKFRARDTERFQGNKRGQDRTEISLRAGDTHSLPMDDIFKGQIFRIHGERRRADRYF